MILGTLHGTIRLHGTGITTTTDTVTDTTAQSGGTTGIPGDGVGQTLGDTAGTGMTDTGIPGTGVGAGDGMTHGTAMADTTVLTIIIGEEAPGTGLTMTTDAIVTTLRVHTIPAGEVSEPEAAAWAAQPALLQGTTDTGLSAVPIAEPLLSVT